jgi:hypothetical protein
LLIPKTILRFEQLAFLVLCCKVLKQRKIIKIKRLVAVFGLSLLFSCSGPHKPATPALTPELAAQLLNFDERAQTFIGRVRKQNPACEFKLTLPDQVPPMTQIDLGHIVQCANRPAPLEFDASATFVYDATTAKWILQRFSS